MDLAEIRKKAKADGRMTPARAERSEGPPARCPAAVQETPGTSAAPQEVLGSKGEPAPLLVFPGLAESDPEDAVEALFRAPLEESGGLSEGNDLEFLQRADVDKEANLRQLLTFSLGSEEYALDIDSIREIIKPREITDIPRVPEFILGIISLRGIIIPVFDLKRRLRLGTGEIKPTSRIIVCQQEEKIIGMLVDGISQVIKIPADSIEPPPAVLAGIDRDMVEGVGRCQGRMTILLRLACAMEAELT